MSEVEEIPTQEEINEIVERLFGARIRETVSLAELKESGYWTPGGAEGLGE